MKHDDDDIFAVEKYFAIGKGAMSVADYRLATKMFRECCRLQPNAIHYLSLAEALGLMEKHEESAQAFMTCLTIDQNCADAWFNMGVMWQRAGNNERAHEAYTNACRMKPENGVWWNNLATIEHGHFLRLEEAEQYYRRAVERGYKPAEMNLALMMMLRGDYLEGLALFEKRAENGDEKAYGQARHMLAALKAVPDNPKEGMEVTAIDGH